MPRLLRSSPSIASSSRTTEIFIIILILFIIFVHMLYVHECVCYSVHVEVRGKLCRVKHFLPLCRFQGLNSGHHQAYKTCIFTCWAISLGTGITGACKLFSMGAEFGSYEPTRALNHWAVSQDYYYRFIFIPPSPHISGKREKVKESEDTHVSRCTCRGQRKPWELVLFFHLFFEQGLSSSFCHSLSFSQFCCCFLFDSVSSVAVITDAASVSNFFT